MTAKAAAPQAAGKLDLLAKPGAWVDLGLTLPVFLAYHLGVVFLHVRNGADVLTGWLMRLAEGSLPTYLAITVGIGALFAGAFYVLGRGQAFAPKKFLQVTIEGVVYAVAMRLGAAYTVQKVLYSAVGASKPAVGGGFTGLVMSLGAGFYEELAFRVVLFGIGAKALVWLFSKDKLGLTQLVGLPKLSLRGLAVTLLWGIGCALIFSGIHYIGPLGDRFAMDSFLFRALLGLALTLIYALRGFATAVWTHALYDIWVLVF